MLSESAPVKNESGRLFERILDLVDKLRSEYQLALRDQARDHAGNLKRLDDDFRELRDKVEAVKTECDRVAFKPPECPAVCQRAQKDLGESITRRFESSGKDVDERLKLIWTAMDDRAAAVQKVVDDKVKALAQTSEDKLKGVERAMAWRNWLIAVPIVLAVLLFLVEFVPKFLLKLQEVFSLVPH